MLGHWSAQAKRERAGGSWGDPREGGADMGVDIHTRRLRRTQIHAQSDPLVLRLTRSQALVIRPIVFFRVAFPATHQHAPHAVLGLIGRSTENEIHICGTLNCVWLGLSPG